MTIRAFCIALAAVCHLAAIAQAQEAVDCDDCQDIPLVDRYPGAALVGAETKAFDEVTLPTGRYVETPAFTYEFPEKRTFEGKIDKLFYHGPKGRSGLEVYANYADALAAAGFETVFACKGDEECGKNFTLGFTDLNPLPAGNITAAQGVPDAERPRYALLHLPRAEGDVYLALYVADLVQRETSGVVITVVETKPMDTGLVTIDADALGKAMLAEGKVALYGVHFDTDSAVIKPDSKAQLDEVAALLAAQPDLKLYVTGHTDSTGSFDHNMQLSAARAAAVVEFLVSTYGVDPARLAPAGLGPTSPVAANETEEGKAKNRRVEIVRQ